MPIRNHTGRQFYRLRGNAGQEQGPGAAGGELSWLLNSIAKVTDGKLCNYLLGIVVTVSGRWTPGGIAHSFSGGPALRTMQRIVRDLVESIEVRAAWHGTVLSSQHVKGSMLELIEFVANGLERPFRRQKPIGALTTAGSGVGEGNPPAPVAEDFRTSFWVPLSLLCGRKGHHTAQPVALYDDAEFVISCNSLTPGAAESPDGVYTNVRFNVVADVLPDREVRLGPGVQWIDYQQATSGEAVDIQNLGRTTTMDRTEGGAGVAGLFLLSNREGLPGPVRMQQLSRITFPFRGLVSLNHTDAVLLQMESMISGLENPVNTVVTGTGAALGAFGQDDVSNFPNAPDDIGIGNARPDPLVLALVCPARDLETSKVQVSEGTQQLQVQFDLGLGGELDAPNGTFHILACQLHSWTPEGFLSAKQKLIDTGVCRAVLKTDDVTWSLKVINKQNPMGITKRKQRFFAMRLVPNSAATPKVA